MIYGAECLRPTSISEQRLLAFAGASQRVFPGVNAVIVLDDDIQIYIIHVWYLAGTSTYFDTSSRYHQSLVVSFLSIMPAQQSL